MKPVKIKVHSSVDLITNSSTTIFTYSQGSIEALKELTNEMLKTFNSPYSFDDIFYADIFLEESYEYFEDSNFPEDQDNSKYLEELKTKILKGEIEKPEWMVKLENTPDKYSYRRRSTTLEIMPRDEKYESLAKQLYKFLYSVDHDAEYQG